MSKDKLTVLKNPTPELEQLKDEVMKISKDVLKKQTSLIETFLFEFCKVNGIEENELSKHLQIAVCTGDKSVMAVNTDDIRDVKFGVKVNLESDKIKFEVFGEYLEHKDKYPKTTKFAEVIENGGLAGNTEAASGK